MCLCFGWNCGEWFWYYAPHSPIVKVYQCLWIRFSNETLYALLSIICKMKRKYAKCERIVPRYRKMHWIVSINFYFGIITIHTNGDNYRLFQGFFYHINIKSNNRHMQNMAFVTQNLLTINYSWRDWFDSVGSMVWDSFWKCYLWLFRHSWNAVEYHVIITHTNTHIVGACVFA